MSAPAPPGIDLHLHTTASDGRLDPAGLVAAASRAGIRIMSVTDHDTVAAIPDAARHAEAAGIEFVAGIEVTALLGAQDVHILGYFIDPGHPGLLAFLEEQRADRLRRLRGMASRLSDLGRDIDAEAVLQRAGSGTGRAIGRPTLARALVRAGYASDVQDAFDTLLGEGRPAYVPRRAPSPEEVIALIADARGISSLAHPGLLGRDDAIPGFASAGLSAVEAYHSDHDREATSRYLAIAETNGLAVSGGSDYHGEGHHRAESLGRVTLPPECYEILAARPRRAAP